MKFNRDAAVDQAMGVFWRRGYASTTPQGLADELGMLKGSLYNTFQSKHNLFTLTLRRYRDMRVESLGELLEGQESVRSALRCTMVELTGAGAHRLGCFAVNSIGELAEEDDMVVQTGESLFSHIEEAFRDAVQRGQALGEFGPGNAGEQARSLLITMIGVSVLAKTGAQSDRLDQVIDEALRPL